MIQAKQTESMTDFCRRVYLRYLCSRKTTESTYYESIYREEVRRGIKKPGFSVEQTYAGQGARWRELYPEKAVEFDRLMESGFSQRDIASRLNMSRNTIRKILKIEEESHGI